MAKDDDKKISRPSLNKITQEDKNSFNEVCDRYQKFLSAAQTPHLAVQEIMKQAEKQQFSGYTPDAASDTFYITNEDQTNIALVRKGTDSFTEGIRIIGAHVDSPCLTAKVHPIREKPEGVMLDCYPYGGIYFHQWFDTAVNVIGHCVKNGKNISFELNGLIADSTIHFSGRDRMKKQYEDAFEAESLDVFIGFKDKDEFLAHMKDEHDITEEDFARSMLTIVPKIAPYRISEHYMAGFGHDDRVCAFGGLHAITQSAAPKKTSVLLVFDREEIGSTGYNGANSRFLEHVIDIIARTEDVDLTDVQMRQMFAKSQMISADVDVAFNSNDASYSQEESASKFGEGLIMDRFNGGANQSYGNNVPLTLVDRYMNLFKKYDIQFKVSAIPPKVNTGGGGTIAMYFAHRGIPVVDMGIPVLSMHGKYPTIFLPDFFQMLKGYKVFFEEDF
ncbi:MAG: hypothetical protein ACOCWQ_00080 [Nanoarchaeota archaeon]